MRLDEYLQQHGQPRTLALSPEENYRQLLAESPDLAQRLTQNDIARYLGITPVALSRIRGRRRRAEGAAAPTGPQCRPDAQP